MNSRERVFAVLEGRPADCLPVMPITMMFAVDQINAKYYAYATDYRVLAEAQIRTAEQFDFDHVSTIAETREAPDCGAVVEYFEDQPPSIVEARALLAEKTRLARLRIPDPLGGGRMHDRVRGIALLWASRNFLSARRSSGKVPSMLKCITSFLTSWTL